MSSGGQNATSVSGYSYSQLQIRDASDYAAYKRQIRIRNDSNIKKTKNLGVLYGNVMRLDYLEGGYKQGLTPSCTRCIGNSFINYGI